MSYQPKVGDKVVIMYDFKDGRGKLPISSEVIFVHPKLNWCTCDIGIFTECRSAEEITPLDDWDSENRPPMVFKK